MRQDVSRHWPIVCIFANVRPDNVAGGVNHKYGGRSYPVAQQVKNAICVGYRVVGIGQNGKAGLDDLGHGLGAVHILEGQSDYFGMVGAKLCVI